MAGQGWDTMCHLTVLKGLLLGQSNEVFTWRQGKLLAFLLSGKHDYGLDVPLDLLAMSLLSQGVL